jgi:hypothetical protein
MKRISAWAFDEVKLESSEGSGTCTSLVVTKRILSHVRFVNRFLCCPLCILYPYPQKNTSPERLAHPYHPGSISIAMPIVSYTMH